MTQTVQALTAHEKEAVSSDDAVMTIDEVMAETKLGQSTIYEMMDVKKFPANFRLWGRKTVWLRSEVKTWLQWRIDTQKGPERWQPPAS